MTEDRKTKEYVEIMRTKTPGIKQEGRQSLRRRPTESFALKMLAKMFADPDVLILDLAFKGH